MKKIRSEPFGPYPKRKAENFVDSPRSSSTPSRPKAAKERKVEVKVEVDSAWDSFPKDDVSISTVTSPNKELGLTPTRAGNGKTVNAQFKKVRPRRSQSAKNLFGEQGQQVATSSSPPIKTQLADFKNEAKDDDDFDDDDFEDDFDASLRGRQCALF